MKLRHLGGKPVGFRTKHRVDVGSKAPDFTLPSQSGEMVSLGDFLGGNPWSRCFNNTKNEYPELRFRVLLTEDGTRQMELVRA
jgi:hypothetical protein